MLEKNCKSQNPKISRLKFMWTQLKERLLLALVTTTRLILTLTPVLQLLNEKTGLTKIGSLKFSTLTDGKSFVIQLKKWNAVLKTDLLCKGQFQSWGKPRCASMASDWMRTVSFANFVFMIWSIWDHLPPFSWYCWLLSGNALMSYIERPISYCLYW